VLVDDGSDGDRLLRTAYFILTTITTVGYGDILPKNTSEFALLSIIMMFAVAFFAYVMGKFNSAITEYNELTASGDNASELNIWISMLENLHASLPPIMKLQIQNHFEYYWKHDRLRSVSK
jgi:hypothetical protein